MTYGLPAATEIEYGAPGFPQWVYDLAAAFGLRASTYANHQSDERPDIKAAPNPQGLNRGIDWAGAPAAMLNFARWLRDGHPPGLEMAIYQDPGTGERVGFPTWVNYDDDFANHRDHVHTRVSQPIPPPGAPLTTLVSSTRPAFSEVEVWSGNNQDRGGTPIDLFLLHTQEGGDGDAEGLARWMDANGVSYHYTVSTGRAAVTVCDVVDTDLASWSCLDANNRSINLCFAGSKVSWTRQQWLDNRNALDAAAYLAVQDCLKYRFPVLVIPPPYTAGRTGISDHFYVTKVLGVGTHTDVGLNFPWDYFAKKVREYSGVTPPAPPPPVTPPAPPLVPPLPAAVSDRQLVSLILAQFGA